MTSMRIGKFLITFLLYPKAWFFGISFADYEELDVYAIGFAIGAGSIVIGVKK